MGPLGGGGSDRDVSGGISVRRVEDMTEALWGTRVSPRAKCYMKMRPLYQPQSMQTEAVA
jgi:hypothetical protein